MTREVNIRRCTVCGASFDTGSRARHDTRCIQCKEARLAARRSASRETWTAIKFGVIPHPKRLTCCDCGKPAECYDHRNYSRPLDVHPVCKSCNSSRGQGIVPSILERSLTSKDNAA